MARKNACYQCEKRSAECHATCEEYQEYFRKREEYRRKMFEKKKIYVAISETKERCILSCTHRKVRRGRT